VRLALSTCEVKSNSTMPPLLPPSSGDFTATPDTGFLACAGVCADRFMGDISNGDGVILIADDLRDITCHDRFGTLTLEFDARVDAPQAPGCIQRSFVEWVVASGTGEFALAEGSGSFEGDIDFESDDDGVPDESDPYPWNPGKP
jgi:hypothetical protein